MRRFALAIRPQSVARSHRFITLKSADQVWTSGAVLVASTWMERWRGVSGQHGRVLLPTAAVHGRGIDGPIWAAGIDSCGGVVEVRLLNPGRFLRVSDASWILELPFGDEPPDQGMVLSIYPR